MVVDPQKWLATSMGCGAVFVRDPLILERAFALEPAVYIEGSQPVAAQDGATTNVTSQFDGFGFMYHNLGIEHTLPSRGVEVWAVLKEIGVDGVRARVSRHIRYARALAKRVQESELLELKAPVVLSTCCFRYAPQDLRTPREASNRAELLNDLNREILRSVRARGRCVPSATTVDGDFVIRACFVNPRTTMYDALLLADEVEQCGSQLWAEMRVQARHNWALEPNR
jgi:aromatic-L-amino-acid decarboxylase